jgi:hypothetical protein
MRKTNEKVSEDIQLHKIKGCKRETDRKYMTLLKRIVKLEKEKEAILHIKKYTKVGSIRASGKTSAPEATAFIMASDWHVEEKVDPATINYVNKFNLKIAEKRVRNLMNNSVKLIEIANREIKVKHLVLSLLGDFINNHIHEEMVEDNYLPPIEACIFATNLISSSIRHLLDKTDLTLTVVCSSGNHARITPKKRAATESGHSLEYFMYHIVADIFKDEKRVNFVIEKGMHTYLNVYNQVIRFSHGDGFRYAGGVSGIYVPANKAIAQWNKVKKANLDVIGHWHQQRDAGNFLCNGSLVGYNAYALSIKADYEEPKQCFFMIDSKGRKINVTPIFLE